MIRPDQIPDEVVEAAHRAFEDTMETEFHLSWARSIAAALSAWPGVTTTSWFQDSGFKAALNLPLPQEKQG